jgi:hypothetical protein
MAFCPKKCLEAWNCGWSKNISLVDVTYIDDSTTKTAGYIGYNNKTKVVMASWRGSDNKANWI